MLHNNITPIYLKSKTNKEKFETLQTIIIFAVILILIAMVIINPSKYIDSVYSGILLWASTVLPALFPFLLLTKILTELGLIEKLSVFLKKPMEKIFKTPAISAYIFLISIISGYPVGAKLIGDFYEKGSLTKTEATRLLSFCTTSGPIFIIGTVGIMFFKNRTVGYVLLLSHIIASVCCGLIFRFIKDKKSENPAISPIPELKHQKQASFDNILSESVYSAVSAILIVGAYISIFYMIIDICFDMGFLNILSRVFSKVLGIFGITDPAVPNGFVSGVIEVTRGCNILSKSGSVLSICFAASLISFSGLSILFQSITFLKNTGIKMWSLLLIKTTHMLITFPICYGLCLLIL